MTKRHQIEKAIAMLDSHIKQNTCLDCPEIFTLLREYQKTFPPDREPWEVAYRKKYDYQDDQETPQWDGANFFRDGYLACEAVLKEKGESK